ncbi:leukocyte tyrosine kinase receptor-like [Branchiostoma floridae]|uniref:Leukocyte tyrosine kinase receptor-like n=1 Tax=Branchiostoma floridae TaxID=7739 RepID=A0A9J7HM38_BRAFL|nr:leukocyte tyrosine kinase receptor-like [Branchiostoma floridae]
MYGVLRLFWRKMLRLVLSLCFLGMVLCTDLTQTQGHYSTTMVYDIFYQNNNNNNNNGDGDNSTMSAVLRKPRHYCQSGGRCPRDGNPKYDDDDLPFRTARFTTLGTRGRLGPTTLGDHYRGQDHEDMVYLRDGVQVFTVPATGVYLLEVAGAAAGWGKADNKTTRGRGAVIWASLQLIKGRLLKILVGQEGAETRKVTVLEEGGGRGWQSPGDPDLPVRRDGLSRWEPWVQPKGGTSFTGGVKGHGAKEGDRDNVGGGGGGLLSRGASSKYFGGKDGAYGGEGGESYIKGCVGGKPYVNGAEGGFGGGGGSFGNGGGGGGGGGYSGGGRGDNWSDACGGGGGSFSAGNETVATDGGNDGPGYVVITKL